MENNFVIESVGTTQKSAPIIRYDWDRRKMKKDEWRRYEHRIYEQAGVFARSTGTRILIIDDGPQGSRRLNENDNWSENHITSSDNQPTQRHQITENAAVAARARRHNPTHKHCRAANGKNTPPQRHQITENTAVAATQIKVTIHGPSREALASGRPQQRTQNVPQNPPRPE